MFEGVTETVVEMQTILTLGIIVQETRLYYQ